MILMKEKGGENGGNDHGRKKALGGGEDKMGEETPLMPRGNQDSFHPRIARCRYIQRKKKTFKIASWI